MKSRLLRERTHTRTVVTLTTGETFNGLLFGFDGVVIKLGDASLVGADGVPRERAGVDGVLLLPWQHVAYMQCP